MATDEELVHRKLLPPEPVKRVVLWLTGMESVVPNKHELAAYLIWREFAESNPDGTSNSDPNDYIRRVAVRLACLI